METYEYIIDTVDEICDAIPPDSDGHFFMNKVKATIVHKAPEVIHEAWVDIFKTCSYHFNDLNIDWHHAILDIYNRRYEQWKNKV